MSTPTNYPLYDYLFHFNPYEQVWSAFKREHKERYFNGELSDSEMFKSKTIKTLVDYIIKINTATNAENK